MTHPFASALLRWYASHGRDLPWRHSADPYPIWLSEVILQQTRIEQGRDYWHRFMERFPTVDRLADATEDEVLRLWQGLGYYSRARNLHTAAKQIKQLGHFPTTLEDIKRLKGVGDYTAAAIASFAFGIPAAVVDGNVYRVLSRHFGIATPINSTEGKKEFATLAQELLPATDAANYNQAIMDFGAIQCTPKSPRCPDCPIADTCQALHSHTVDTLPVKLKKLTISTRHLQYIYIKVNGETAIRRRPAGDIWQGLWEPLLIENAPIPKMEGKLTLLRQKVKHVLTHRVLYADFYLLEADTKPTLPHDFIWIPEPDIDQYALPRLIEILIQEIRK
ncbi:MAG: A/G-specific adenine glycosylase [Bacteroidales bacterium]|nr:A/G-specific adenine glycosylase [Bacteroidales bacterium]